MSVIGLFILAVLQEFLISYRASLGLKAAKGPEGSSSDINVNLTGNRFALASAPVQLLCLRSRLASSVDVPHTKGVKASV